MIQVHQRRDSAGNTHRIFSRSEDGISLRFPGDSVQVTCDGRFRVGDLVRPTRQFIDEVLNGSIPLDYIAQWNTGYKIKEIGPEGFPWKGTHDIELEGFDVIGLTAETIEKV